MFEPFWQVDTTLTRTESGLGLGLAIVRSLVEAHGGTVRAESRGLGLGSCFIVELPRAMAANAENVQDVVKGESQITYGTRLDGRIRTGRGGAIRDRHCSNTDAYVPILTGARFVRFCSPKSAPRIRGHEGCCPETTHEHLSSGFPGGCATAGRPPGLHPDRRGDPRARHRGHHHVLLGSQRGGVPADTVWRPGPSRRGEPRQPSRVRDVADFTRHIRFGAADPRGVSRGPSRTSARAVTVAGAGVAERVQAAEVSGDLFSFLGVPVQLGRPLSAADAGTRVVVIGDDLWVKGLGSNPEVVGSMLSVDGDHYVVVGVAGRGFSFPQDSRVWLPLDTAASDRSVDVVARLEPGVSGARAETALSVASADTLTGLGDGAFRAIAVTTSLRLRMIGTKQRNMALFVLTAAGLVLLVACANLAGLLTAFVGARKREMAVRAAIGAGRLRLVRQLMTESVMLAVAGGTMGMLLAQWGVDVVRRHAR